MKVNSYSIHLAKARFRSSKSDIKVLDGEPVVSMNKNDSEWLSTFGRGSRMIIHLTMSAMESSRATHAKQPAEKEAPKIRGIVVTVAKSYVNLADFVAFICSSNADLRKWGTIVPALIARTAHLTSA